MAAIVQATVDQIVDHGEECGQGFAGASGRGDQGRPMLADQRPRPGLGGGDRREGVAEPGADGRVEASQGSVHGDGQIQGVFYGGGGGKMQVPLGSCVDPYGPIASKLAPTLDLCMPQIPYGSGLAREEAGTDNASLWYSPIGREHAADPLWERACSRRGQ